MRNPALNTIGQEYFLREGELTNPVVARDGTLDYCKRGWLLLERLPRAGLARLVQSTPEGEVCQEVRVFPTAFCAGFGYLAMVDRTQVPEPADDVGPLPLASGAALLAA